MSTSSAVKARGNLSIVVGGQFGSEGKGAVAGWLARAGEDRGRGEVTVAVRVAGPNAGHSAMDLKGKVWPLRCIPVMAVTNLTCQLVLAAGSEINEKVLLDEITELEAAGIPILNRLSIDWQATVLTDGHIHQESDGDINSRLGSTAKGIGAARADRIWRTAPVWGLVTDEYHDVQVAGMDTVDWLRQLLADPGEHVVIEGTQGFGLGLHAGLYPKCTSSDCRAIDFAAMAGITPWTDAGECDVWVTLRTHPIRVAGNSGPMYKETSWEALSNATNGYIKPEKTTVTHKTRRVGEWDEDLAREAVKANGGPSCRVALTFFDYWFPDLCGEQDVNALTDVHWGAIQEVERQINARVHYLGTGPGDGIQIYR